MATYRTKSIQIEARQVTDETLDELVIWCGGYAAVSEDRTAIEIPTLEGTLTVQVGDWLVRDADGRPEPMGADEFEATYEPA